MAIQQVRFYYPFSFWFFDATFLSGVSDLLRKHSFERFAYKKRFLRYPSAFFLGLVMIWTFAILGLALIAAVLAAREGTKHNRKIGSNISQKSPLSTHEQALYSRLLEALPEHIVLPQVAFSALMTADKRATRSAFESKVANFVVCDKSFKVLAIITSDVDSYKGKEAVDARHDMILQRVGYKNLRYKSIPDIRKVKADIASLAQNADQVADPA